MIKYHPTTFPPLPLSYALPGFISSQGAYVKKKKFENYWRKRKNRLKLRLSYEKKYPLQEAMEAPKSEFSHNNDTKTLVDGYMRESLKKSVNDNPVEVISTLILIK